MQNAAVVGATVRTAAVVEATVRTAVEAKPLVVTRCNEGHELHETRAQQEVFAAVSYGAAATVIVSTKQSSQQDARILQSLCHNVDSGMVHQSINCRVIGGGAVHSNGRGGMSA